MDTPEPTFIDFLILADRAESSAGKLYMIGGAVDRLAVLDGQQPIPLTIVVGLAVRRQDTGTHLPLRVTLRPVDGPPLRQVDGSIRVDWPEETPDWFHVRTSVAINGLWSFGQSGVYEIEATIGESQPRRTPFIVRVGPHEHHGRSPTHL